MQKRKNSELPSNSALLIDWALYYRRLGWCVIPIGFDKKPPKGFKWKQYQRVRPDESQLREWFADGKYTSLAVICGAVSGSLVVLDLDSEERCQWWRGKHADLAKALPTAKTKQGMHVYFRAEPLRKQNGDDADLLGEGAYAILPPSPDKEWIIFPNGELLLLDPFEWGLEQFGINRPQKGTKEFTEETEDIERHRSHKVGCVFESLDDETNRLVEKAIESTLPQKLRIRNDNIFVFCQWLKGIPAMRDLKAVELKPIVRLWWARAYNNVRTKPFTYTYADFVHGWKRVKWPKGDFVLERAVRKALEAKEVLPELKPYEDIPEAVFLGRIYYELQQIMGDKPIFLASRKAKGIVGVSHTTILKWTEMFEADGILKLVFKGKRTKDGGVAPRYRYVAN